LDPLSFGISRILRRRHGFCFVLINDIQRERERQNLKESKAKKQRSKDAKIKLQGNIATKKQSIMEPRGQGGMKKTILRILGIPASARHC
jgi:hypothetical protein